MSSGQARHPSAESRPRRGEDGAGAEENRLVSARRAKAATEISRGAGRRAGRGIGGRWGRRLLPAQLLGRPSSMGAGKAPCRPWTKRRSRRTHPRKPRPTKRGRRRWIVFPLRLLTTSPPRLLRPKSRRPTPTRRKSSASASSSPPTTAATASGSIPRWSPPTAPSSKASPRRSSRSNSLTPPSPRRSASTPTSSSRRQPLAMRRRQLPRPHALRSAVAPRIDVNVTDLADGETLTGAIATHFAAELQVARRR